MQYYVRLYSLNTQFSMLPLTFLENTKIWRKKMEIKGIKPCTPKWMNDNITTYNNLMILSTNEVYYMWKFITSSFEKGKNASFFFVNEKKCIFKKNMHIVSPIKKKITYHIYFFRKSTYYIYFLSTKYIYTFKYIYIYIYIYSFTSIIIYYSFYYLSVKSSVQSDLI